MSVESARQAGSNRVPRILAVFRIIYAIFDDYPYTVAAPVGVE
jgi:hypothetical protein